MNMIIRRLFLFLIAAFAMMVTSSGTYATTSPIDNGDLSFYARIESGAILHSDQWAVIIFYRPPECVPDDFNLLDFIDNDAPNCLPLAIEGFMVQSGGPVPSTIQTKLNGLGTVPVWFVAWPELAMAVADGMLTMTELEGLSSRVVGTATFYTETQNPKGVGKKPSVTNYDAQGSLEDGRSFNVHMLVVSGKVINVTIVFVEE